MPHVRLFWLGIEVGKRRFELARTGLVISRELTHDEVERLGLEIHKVSPGTNAYVHSLVCYLAAVTGRVARIIEAGQWTITPPATTTSITFDQLWRDLQFMTQPVDDDAGKNALLANPPDSNRIGHVNLHLGGEGLRKAKEYLLRIDFNNGPPRTIVITIET